MMRIVYLGTAEIASPALCALHAQPDMEVVLVVTQPDRPQGRRRLLAPCPLKETADVLGLPVFSPDKISDKEACARILDAGADIHVVFAYGQYIPMSLADAPCFRSINAHPSLLPKYRGASPIQAALANGDEVSGLSIMYVARQMDAGDILLQHSLPLEADENAGQLHDRMAMLGARLLVDAVRGLAAGTLIAQPQDGSRVVECSKLKKEDGRMDWQLPAAVLRNRIRAFTPWPGAYFDPGNGSMLKVLRAAVEEGDGPPGTVLSVEGSGPLIATGAGALRLLEVQPPGKKAMSGAAYLRGNAMESGARLEGQAPA